jgi:NAD-dependent SIR2 family protein deacetylase
MWKPITFTKMHRPKEISEVKCLMCHSMIDTNKAVRIKRLCSTTIYCKDCYEKYKPSKFKKGDYHEV